MTLTATQRKILAGIAFGVVAFIATLLAGPDEEKQKEAVRTVCDVADAVRIDGFGADYCTHGPDPRNGILRGKVDSAKDEARVARFGDDRQICHGGGRAGYRVAVFYAYPEGQTDRSAEMVPKIEQWMREAQVRIDISHNTRSQNIRYLCTAGRPLIRTFTLPALDGSFTYTDATNALRDAGYPAFRWKGKRIFEVFVDHVAQQYDACGEGTVGGGDLLAGHVGITACFGEHTFLHELGHNLGAVQPEAPHDSGGYHCHETNDVMCYPDGGSYFQRGGSMSPTCLDGIMRWDCNLEDYWDPVNDFAWWNTADSPFLSRPFLK